LTFYVRVKVTPPKPVLITDRCFLTYGTTVVNANQTLEVNRGSTVGANYGVRNDGGDGQIAVQLWDTRNNREVLRKEFSLASGSQRIESLGSFTVDSDMDLVFITYYWDGSNWVQVDSYGSPWWLKKASGKVAEVVGYLRVK